MCIVGALLLVKSIKIDVNVILILVWVEPSPGLGSGCVQGANTHLLNYSATEQESRFFSKLACQVVFTYITYN